MHSTEFQTLRRLLENRNAVYRLLVVDELAQAKRGEVSELVKEVGIPTAFVSGDIHLSGGGKGNSHWLHEDAYGQLQQSGVHLQLPRSAWVNHHPLWHLLEVNA